MVGRRLTQMAGNLVTVAGVIHALTTRQRISPSYVPSSQPTLDPTKKSEREPEVAVPSKGQRNNIPAEDAIREAIRLPYGPCCEVTIDRGEYGEFRSL